MKKIRLLTALFCAGIATVASAQEVDRAMTLSVFTGAMNYQGDLKPNNFTSNHCSFTTGISVRKPLNYWFALRGGVNVGSIEASDAWNDEDLRPRNLSFNTTVKEAYLGLEISILDISTGRFTPYVYAGVAAFHFNPWTRDRNNEKVYLQPLGTEGQGIAGNPQAKPYKLTQFCLPFGGGIRVALSDAIRLGIEFNQRKTFTDYLDDVSGTYADADALMQAHGPMAVDLAYRADELPNARAIYPAHGEKRGTPSEMDWYYFFGTTLEIKMSSLGGLFHKRKSIASQRCPRNILASRY